MIHTNRIVTVGEQESTIDRPIVLYRGDREVEIEFTLVGNEFTFSEEGNVIKSANASHGQLVLNTPSGEHMFSELVECHEGKVAFVVTKEMIDEFIEMGFYSFQIRLYDSAEMKSRVTIPPVLSGFDIRNPIATEDEAYVVDQGIVDDARVYKDQFDEELPTFDSSGAYNKTEWARHDVITKNKMNKIEDALYFINANIKDSDEAMLNALDKVKKDADKYVKEHMAEVEADVEEFERNLNVEVEQFKIDVNANIHETDEVVFNALDNFKKDADDIKEHMAEVEEFERNLNAEVDQFKIDVNSQLAYHALQIDNNMNNNRINVKDHGAIGDWSSHPASDFYSSLEELQKDYPKAQSLNDEMDTLALEKVLTSSARTVYIPYGGYKLNRAGFSIPANKCIVGDSKVVTQLSYTGVDEYIFKLEGDGHIIKDFKIDALFEAGKKGTTNGTTFIYAQASTHNTFSDLFIIGFDKGINFGTNSWIQYINNVQIQNCNTGIYGNGEFNNICISQCSISYCKLGIGAGGGRNIVIQMCDIESNNTAIEKVNNGDIIIRDNYFALNKSGNILITWGMSAVDMAIIDGNSFYTTTAGEPMITYHSEPTSNIVVTNNNFQCDNLNKDVTISCLIPTSESLVCPVFKNNRLNKGYVVGVDGNKINSDGFYKNGNHMKYVNSADLRWDLNSQFPSVMIPFEDNAYIHLPSFSSLEDNTQCFKLFAFSNPDQYIQDHDYMLIEDTDIIICGSNKILANQMYSIFFNGISGDMEEIIIIKG